MKVTIAGSADVANLPSSEHDRFASFHRHLQISNMDHINPEWKRKHSFISKYKTAPEL